MKKFEGVMLYPTKVKKDLQSKSLIDMPGTMIGVWVRQDITPEQRKKLMGLNESFEPGHIGVRSNAGGTAVMFVGQVESTGKAHAIAYALGREVSAVLATKLVPQSLPTYCSISRALAMQ